MGGTEIFCWISTYERTLSLFSGNAVITYKMQAEQKNWVYVKNIFLHSTNKFILVCKLVTVNCLSQYSGCKCILTFMKKTMARSQALHLFSSDLHTYHMRDINDQLNVSFH